MEAKDPADFLKLAIGKNVLVKLNSGFSYKGKVMQYKLVTNSLHRYSHLSGWFHEYCHGKLGRVLWFTEAEFIQEHFYSRK